MGRNAFWAAVLLALVACGGEAVVGDGSVDGGVDGAVVAVIPWLERGAPPLMLTPCPEGWQEAVDADGIAVCDAYPAAGPTECPFGQAHFPGEPGCRAIGSPCPEGDWPAGLPADDSAIIYVAAGATGGDGSRAAPFGQLSEVPWSVRGVGWTVALAKGRYEGALPLRAGVAVVGACAAETIVTDTDSAPLAVVSLDGGASATTLKDLAIVDAANRGVRVAGGGHLVIEGVLIQGVAEVGVDMGNVGTEVEATDLVIDATRPLDDGFYGYGISVDVGSSLVGRRMVLSDNNDIALFAQNPGATVTATDIAVFGTTPRPDGPGGRAINAQLSASLSVERAWLSDNADVAFYLSEASAAARDIVVNDTHPQGDGTDGRAFGIQDGSVVEMSRVTVRGSHEVGLLLDGIDTTLTLTDAIIADTVSQESDGRYGRGLSAQSGARLVATRVLLARSRNVGIYASEVEMELNDVAVDAVSAEPDGLTGVGVQARDEAIVTASRVAVTESLEVGVAVFDGARLDGRQVVIEDTRRSACACDDRVLGYGAAAIGGSLALEGFRVAQSATCGLFVENGGPTLGALDVAHGVVAQNVIGACVQVDGYALDRLTTDVDYRDNDTNLETTRLLVPEPIDGLSL